MKKLVTIGTSNALTQLENTLTNLGSGIYDLHSIKLKSNDNKIIDIIDLYKINNADAVIIFGTWGSNDINRIWSPKGTKDCPTAEDGNQRRQAWLELLNSFIVNYCKSINKKVIVIETATLSRIRIIRDNKKHWKDVSPFYYRMALNHWTYGIGTFCKPKGSDRLDKFYKCNFLALKDIKPVIDNFTWRNNKQGKILLCSGLENDPTSTKPVDDFVKDTIEELKQYTKREILVKPHPLSRFNFEDYNVLSKETTIKDISSEIYCAVIDNSTSIFELIHLGIPCFTSQYNFGYNLKNVDIKNIEDPYYATPEEVKSWYEEMSYTEFSFNEFSNQSIFKYIDELLEL